MGGPQGLQREAQRHNLVDVCMHIPWVHAVRVPVVGVHADAAKVYNLPDNKSLLLQGIQECITTRHEADRATDHAFVHRIEAC